MARLREEDIPYTVVGGLSLFETAEIRDLEQAMRAIADPHDDAALVRMMTAGPWRLDALEILRVSRTAKFERAHLLETIKAIVESGQVEVDVVNERREDGPNHEAVDAPALTRAKLRQLLAALDELTPLTFREGPHTILERFLERTGVVLDLIAADTLEAKRIVTNIASFMRFAADWQAANHARDVERLRRVSRCVPGGRWRAADERGAVRGRRWRAADDAVPGQGARVPDRVRPESARRGVARP